jgi:hypothetical protein
MRLLCSAHNQRMAERVFGTEFMSDKRKRARHASAANRARAANGG